MDKLGIIGGMGPLATNIFYNKIISKTLAEKDQDHIWTVISSHSTMTDRTSVIVNNDEKSVILDAVKEDLKIMEAAGVSTIAIPCNTFHYFYDDVASLTNIEIINMVFETLKVYKENFGDTACVLSTKGTKEARVYEKYADKLGIKLTELPEETVDRLNKIVYNIKSTNNVIQPEFWEITRNIKEEFNPDGFIIACTELSLISHEDGVNKKDFLDAMDVLVVESILRCGYPLK